MDGIWPAMAQKPRNPIIAIANTTDIPLSRSGRRHMKLDKEI